MEGLAWSGQHIQYTDDVLQNCTPKTYNFTNQCHHNKFSKNIKNKNSKEAANIQGLCVTFSCLVPESAMSSILPFLLSQSTPIKTSSHPSWRSPVVGLTECVYSCFGPFLLFMASSFYLKLNSEILWDTTAVLETPSHSPTQWQRGLCRAVDRWKHTTEKNMAHQGVISQVRLLLLIIYILSKLL